MTMYQFSNIEYIHFHFWALQSNVNENSVLNICLMKTKRKKKKKLNMMYNVKETTTSNNTLCIHIDIIYMDIKCQWFKITEMTKRWCMTIQSVTLRNHYVPLSLTSGLRVWIILGFSPVHLRGGSSQMWTTMAGCLSDGGWISCDIPVNGQNGCKLELKAGN